MRTILRAVLLLALLGGVLAVQAQTVNDEITQCATKLAKVITAAGLKHVGVPEMTSGAGDQLGGNTGWTGKYFALKLDFALTNMSNGAFEVEDRNRLNRVLQEGKFEASGLTDPKASQQLLGKLPGLDGLVDGALIRFDESHTLEMDCCVIRYPEAINLGGVSVKIELDPDLLEICGVSFHVPEQTPPEQIVHIALHPPAESPIPEVDANSPFALEVLVNDQPESLYQHEGHYYVPAAAGESYAIRLSNKSDKPVAVALYIDGLNTIKEEQVLPSQADKWVVKEHSSVIIAGWQADMEYRNAFVFANSEESLAARKHYTDKIGLITATFFPLADDNIKVAPGNNENSTARGLLGTDIGSGSRNSVMYDTRSFATTPVASLTLHYDNRELVQTYRRVKGEE